LPIPGDQSTFVLVTKKITGKVDADVQRADLDLRDSFSNMFSELSFPDDTKELKKAFSRAIQRWKSKNAQNCNDSTNEETSETRSAKKTTSTGNSFSLFDQLQGSFALPVSLDEIREASSTEERLKVFQKIKYLEDLLMDWNEICPILKNDLTESALQCPKIAFDIIALHRKWFDQGRSSSEYTLLLYDMCQNLLETLAKSVQLEDTCETLDIDEKQESCLVASLVQNWRDMWVDIMQRDQYSEVLAREMENCMLSLFLRNDRSKKGFLAQKVLARVDPSARWFHSWTYHVRTNDHILLLLCNPEEEKTVLSELWIEMNSFPDGHAFNLDKASLSVHSTAVISIILCRTRLSEFPWEGLTQSTTLNDKVTACGDTNVDNFTTTIDDMLDLFLRVLVFLSREEKKNSSDSNEDLKAIILDGVEAIIAGSHGNKNNSDFNRRYNMVTGTLRNKEIEKDTAVTRFLERQLN